MCSDGMCRRWLADLLGVYATCVVVFFFFQAEDGIRDYKVTGVQTCALPIWSCEPSGGRGGSARRAGRRVCDSGRASRAAAAEARGGAPGGESVILVVRAERRPRRLGEARREASL